jgi:DNA-binding GntR family transcriptional regulator
MSAEGPSGTPSRDEFDFVHRELRRAILAGELEPGRRLSQVQLAERMGMSRGPLREALRMLQREGLVEYERNRQVRVARFSIPDLEQLYAMRITLEAMAIRLTVPRLGGPEVAELDRLMCEMDELAVAGDVEAWEVPHRSFHRRLTAGAGERVIRTLDELADHSERYRRVYVSSTPRAWSQGAAEHASIVAAVRERDVDAAAERLARHLARTALSVMTTVAPEHEPAVVRSVLRTVAQPAEPAPAR